MHVLHLIPYFARRFGGPVFGTASLASAQVAGGMQVTLGTARRDDDGERPPVDDRVTVIEAPTGFGGPFRRAPGLATALESVRPDVVHSSGLWTYMSPFADRFSRAQDVPHVLAPCGMLQPDALKRSSWKKRICRVWFQDRVLRSAPLLHAKSDVELEAFRAFGLTQPVAVIPNPVETPSEVSDEARANFRRAHDIRDGHRVALFMGRLHPVKGLSLFLDAWADTGTDAEGWTLVLAGADEAGHRAELEAQLDALRLRDTVRFVGLVEGEEKGAAFAVAELLVLPSVFENYGLAAAEALAVEVPVLTSNGTPWRLLPDVDGGWWVPRTREGLAAALRESLASPSARLAEMGANGRALIEEMLPLRVAERWSAAYRWVVDGGEPPDDVTT